MPSHARTAQQMRASLYGDHVDVLGPDRAWNVLVHREVSRLSFPGDPSQPLSEWHSALRGASDVLRPSPVQSTTGCRAQSLRAPSPRPKLSTQRRRSATPVTCFRNSDSGKAATDASNDCNSSGTVAKHTGLSVTMLATECLLMSSSAERLSLRSRWTIGKSR